MNAKTRHESRRHSHIHHQDAISTTATPTFVGTVTCSNSHDDGEVCKDHETRVQQESKTKSAKNSGKSPRNLSGPMETVQSPDGASKRECLPVRRSVLSAKYSQPEGEASQTSPQVVQRSEVAFDWSAFYYWITCIIKDEECRCLSNIVRVDYLP